MADKSNEKKELSMPVIGMLLFGPLGAIVSALSFVIMPHWPLPVSVSPYFGAGEGAAWGLVVGTITGLVIGYLVDDSHFPDSTY